MMKMLKKNKGFTLIEIIVVIVILAVLMAVAVPSVLSYINEADDAKYETAARAVYVASTAGYAKEYAGTSTVTATNLKTYIDEKLDGEVTYTSIKVYANAKGNVKGVQIEGLRPEGVTQGRGATVVGNKKVTLATSAKDTAAPADDSLTGTPVEVK
ncbi:prepilin-type N-terminal cleavage/methylation domain-containing protein [Sharpea azabuensis]|uniref:prepilin-type N-terminal cleavage/methylation domain-containing protein n=1 Tax=Sharpea azabuensis TaxID=322505 RepID=UPI0023F29729|nr:prepilin-type N-terminal cleavage/methylation domain-containing protein [Sharpea azabuensis]